MCYNSVMNNLLSPQSLAIYQELSKAKYMTAQKLGAKLGIFPQAAYRALKPLEEMGVVEQTGGYPRKYRVKASEDSLKTYLKTAQEEYIKTFLPKDKEKNSLTQLLKIEFIPNRSTYIQRVMKDMEYAKQQIDHIVSGEEVPAETVLARKKALARGVKLRFIVQRVDEFKKYMFANWKRLGLQVRYFPVLEARIIIIDKKIVYITSYNPNVNEEAVGVRFDYAPIARLMQELFEKRWAKAKEV
jgi:sugar-specific transcriptional regulator TrmB